MVWTPGLYQATESGHFVSEAHARIAQIIADYDPNLRLAFIPESERNPDDPLEKPFAVIDLGDGTRPPTAIFFADDCDERLLTRVFENDLARVDVRSHLEAQETARQAIRWREQMDRMDHAADVARTLKRRSYS